MTATWQCRECDTWNANSDRACIVCDTPWRPASHCDRADHTLTWDERALGWVLHHGDTVLDQTPGYPVGAPPVTGPDARTWADGVLGGPQQWIEHPPGSSTWHTH